MKDKILRKALINSGLLKERQGYGGPYLEYDVHFGCLKEQVNNQQQLIIALLDYLKLEARQPNSTLVIQKKVLAPGVRP